MANLPSIPESAPFTPEQRAWLNGYLAGLFYDLYGAEAATASAKGAAPAKTEPLLILYGSQTGTAEQIAKRIGSEATRHGFTAKIAEMNAYGSIDLKSYSRLLIVTSTWGDGDPPDNALAFWNYLNSEPAPQLSHLSYAVLALGDKNYADFCGAGKKFDVRLEQLGAKRVHPRADCDTDYEATAKAWTEAVWSNLKSVNGASPAESTETPAPAAKTEEPAKPVGYSRNNPFPARLVTNLKLNADGSEKDTRHLEISLEGSGLAYEVGDALGVYPTNCPQLVDDLVKALGCDGEEAVKSPHGKETSLRHALLHDFQITQPPASFLKDVAERANNTTLKELLDPARKADLDKYLYGREIIDLLLENPGAKFTHEEFVGYLRKLQPRLYSISSSPKAHPGQVHLTVGVVRYESHGRQRKGVCSTFFADRVSPTTPVPVFIQTSHGFRLPVNGDTPIIMVGPGTGIAPFRAFLEERRATNAKGKNWLLFGDQRQSLDFLYRDQLEAMVKEGTLTRLDLAFSRDQKEKIYVQNRMLENAAELWKWLEAGAHLYVCGDAKRMAKDVDAALHKVIETAGGRTPEQAAEYVQKMKQEKRYQRDVY